MKKKQFYQEIKKLMLQLEFLIEEDIEFDTWEEHKMIDEDIKKLEEALEILKSI